MTRIENRRSPSAPQPVSPAKPAEAAAAAQPAVEQRTGAPAVASDRLVGAALPASASVSAEAMAETHASLRSSRSERRAAAAARKPVAVEIYPDDPVVDGSTVRRDAPGHWFDRDAKGHPVAGPAGDRTVVREDGTPILNLPNTHELASQFPEYLFGGDQLTEYKMDFPLARPNANGDFTHLKPGSVEHDQILAHVYTHQTLDQVEKYLGRKLQFGSEDGRITINPHAGVGLNAFYDPNNHSINFLMFMDKDGKVRSTGQASDIVEHEFGHAINHAIRPKMWSGMETYYDLVNRFGFSEGKSDETSLLTSLSDPAVRRKMLEETGGDLSRKNVASQLGETMGKALKDFGYTDEEAVRSFVNPLKKDELDKKLADWIAANPEPDQNDPTPVILGYQMGQALATATYDLVKNLYDAKVAETVKPEMTPEQRLDAQDRALAEATETVAQLANKARDFDPMTGRHYKLEKHVQGMLKADKLLTGGANADAIAKAYEARNFLTPLDKLDLQQEMPATTPLAIEHGTKPERARAEAQKWLQKNHDVLGLPGERNSEFKVDLAEADAFGNTVLQVRQDLKDFDKIGECVDASMYQDMGTVGAVFDADGKLVHLDKESVLTDREIDVIRGDLTAQQIACEEQNGATGGTEYFSPNADNAASVQAKTRVLEAVQSSMREQLGAAGFALDKMPPQMLNDYIPQSFNDIKVKFDIQRDERNRPQVVVQAQFATKQGAFVVQQKLSDAVEGKKNFQFRPMFGHIDGPAHKAQDDHAQAPPA